MASNNVAQFATELKMSADLLLTQLRAAGVDKNSTSDSLTKKTKIDCWNTYVVPMDLLSTMKKEITLTRKESPTAHREAETAKAHRG